MTTTPVVESNPSISASSWFNVCSRSSFETNARAAALTDRVDLVDEDDRGRALPRLAEQIANPRRTDADEHLHEARPVTE